MDEQAQQKRPWKWTPQLLLSFLKAALPADGQRLRDTMMEHIDPRGLKLNEAAALHTLENSEKLMGQLEQLLAPRPGERSNLEKILTLLEVVARSNAQILQGQENLDGRLAEIELQIAALNAFWTSQDSHL